MSVTHASGPLSKSSHGYFQMPRTPCTRVRKRFTIHPMRLGKNPPPNGIQPWIFDPAWILRARGIEPDAWQRDVLLSPRNRLLLNCSRQVGKTTVVATLALHRALICPGRPVVIIAPSLRQSMELFRQVVEGHQALGNPLGIRGRGLGRLDFANGSRVLALPGRAETIRGIGGVGLLVIDEASRVEDDLYKSVRPMLAATQGKLVALSTPFGRRGWFHEEWTGDNPWSRIRIPWQDCPRITQGFIDTESRSLGERWIQQEYGCEFVSGSGLVYPDFEKTLARQPEGECPGRLVGGIDFGWRNPFAAIWGTLLADGHLVLNGERVLAQTPLSDHARALPKGVSWWADPAGRTEIEELRRAGIAVRPGTNAINAGLACVTSRIRNGRLTIDPVKCPALIREFSLYRWPDEASGEASHESPIDADNHALAALRYLVMGIDRRPARSVPTAGIPAPQASFDPDLWTLLEDR